MKVFAVIVTYNPQIENLYSLCKRLIENEVEIILVDNSTNNILQAFEENEGIHFISLNDNFGIAFAQNAGIHIALTKGAEIVMFFDQDSKIEIDFVTNLLTPIIKIDPIIVAPVFFDEQQNFEYPSFRFNSLKLLSKVYSGAQIHPYQVDVIISSGSAATKSVFEKAGLMDEDFFIDFVDLEWALRCKKNGIPIFVVPNAVMKHSIGIKSINLGFIRIFIHSAERSYYKLRNSFLLRRKSSVPVAFATKEIISALVHQLLTLFIVRFKRQYLKMFFLAIVDGVKGKKGKRVVKTG